MNNQIKHAGQAMQKMVTEAIQSRVKVLGPVAKLRINEHGEHSMHLLALGNNIKDPEWSYNLLLNQLGVGEHLLTTAPDSTFQSRVAPWMQECFGPIISADLLERGDRILEEIFEMLQAVGYPVERVLPLRDYTWSRPIGEPSQEVGGVMVTLAAFCLAHGLDMHMAAEMELTRILQPEIIEKIRAKQAAKAAKIPFSPLPVAPDENLVTVDKRDMFDFVRGAIKSAMETDDCKMSQAELWSVANDHTVTVMEKLFPINDVEHKAAA